ncbi:hypothetical protein J4218_04565 [Candidatus Pacearchaeota archaeon]|nr:hypothetical protein [Candidatus Pacearchaeota archaeon]
MARFERNVFGRSRDRDGGRDRDSRGRSFGGRSRDGGRDRDSRRPLEMFNVTCDKCGVRCQVPFKPTGNKPVLCSECFEKKDGFSSRGNSSSAGASSEQLSQINKKLDKILLVLSDLELETDMEAEGGEEFDEEEEDDEDLDEDKNEDDSEEDVEEEESEKEEKVGF